MHKHCLITGGSGFVGQHLLAALTSQGHSATLLMREPQRLPALAQAIERLGGRAELLSAVSADLSRPGLALSAADRAKVSEAAVVFHLAALFGWDLTTAQARQVNVTGALQVAELAVQQGSRMLLAGGFMLANHAHLRSLGVDLQQPGRTDWDAVYRRAGGYEGSKLEAYFRVRAYMAQHQGALTVVHPATVCGHSRTGHILPGQPLASLIGTLAAGQLGAIPGSAKHWLPLVTVDFLAELIIAVGFDEQQVGQDVLALDAATPNLRALVQELAAVLKVSAPRWHIAIPLLRALLKIPGMPRLLHSDAQALDFIQTKVFDTSATQALARRYQLTWPDINEALRASARYLMERG
jgi:dihydroflavonol-4-reductase